MNHRFSAYRRLLGAAILGLACALLATADARAGTLIINITDGITSYDIFDQFPPDVNFNLNQIVADPTTLLFPDYAIVELTASSNNPGAGNSDGAVLTVGGTVTRLTGSPSSSLFITAYQTDFTLPAGSPLKLISTTSTSYSNAASGSSQAFQSWYNTVSPATPPPPFGLPAPPIVLPLMGTNSPNEASTDLAGLPAPSALSLTNQIVLTIAGVGATVTFSGRAQVLAPTAVPEPSTFALAALGGLGLVGVIRRCRRA